MCWLVVECLVAPTAVVAAGVAFAAAMAVPAAAAAAGVQQLVPCCLWQCERSKVCFQLQGSLLRLLLTIHSI
jgi:hypothetical protein